MIKLKSKDGLQFRCEFCDQQFTHLTVNLSVLLYGVAVLSGKKLSCIGVKCPSCLKTFLVECDDLFLVFNQLNEIVSPTKGMSGPILRYNSSVTNEPFNIAQLNKFEKFACQAITRGQSPPSLQEQAVAYMNEEIPKEKDDLLSSYILDPRFMADPIGPVESVSFFLQKDIEELAEIENRENIRVFPRYVYDLKFYRRLNEFCWGYYFYEKRFGYENTLGDVQEIAQDQSFQAEAVFLSLLLDDPDPFYGDLSAPAYLKKHTDFYAEVWKFKNPFKGGKAPTEFSEVEHFQFEPSDKHAHMIYKIKENQRKAYTLEFLADNYPAFIKEYIALAQQSDFCYGHLWELKWKYLKALHGVIEQGNQEGVAVNVHPQGSTLTINFSGGPSNTGGAENASQAVAPNTEKSRQEQKNKRHSSRIRKKVRLVAEQLWDEDPSTTIADMVFADEISEIAKKKNDEMYSEATIKNWIKDLAPNRKPGRRPKKDEE